MVDRSSTARSTRVVTVASLALVLALLPMAPRAASAPEAAAPGATRLAQGTGTLPSWQTSGPDQIRLLAAAFDPLADSGPSVAGIGRVTSVPAGTSAHWLVQVQGRDFAGATTAIEAAGATVAGFVPDAAYLVRATPAQIATLSRAAPVRWTGLYQPAWKVPTRIGTFPGLMELEGRQRLKVYGFRGDPAASRLAAALQAIGGVTVKAAAGPVVEIEATTAAVPAIVSLPTVQWVEAKGRLAALNANARWVNDTGVRDLFNATLPGRLNGAGQVAGVADTAINYTTSSNGTANSYFSDCRAGGCVKADYEQVTSGPGSADVNLRTIKANGTNHRKVVAFFDIGATGPNPPDESSHGTHVSGSVVGDTGAPGTWNRADGMAPGARLVSQNISTASGGLTGPADDYELWRQAYRPRNPGSVPTSYDPADYARYRASEDARTHNNSYGLLAPVISLGSAEAADRFVWDHEDMVIISSAGNEGPDAASVGAPSIGRNVVTSAASGNGRQPMVSVDSLASFSSHGPGQSGDFGVDLATPGQIVVSAKGGTNDDEHVLQGTSMSGPLLTGLATLVRQYFFDGYAATGAGSSATARRASGFAAGLRSTGRRSNPSAALVRATMVNGADRMRGFYTGAQGSQRSLDGQYPSAGQGFGLVNLRNSLYFDDAQGKSTTRTWYQDVYRGDAAAFDVGDAGPLAEREYTINVAPGAPLDVTLAFSDAPSALGTGSVAVNNLDLEVEAPDGTVYAGNNFNTETTPSAADYATLPGALSDPVNPVEKVRLPAPAAGTYTVRVRGTTVAMGPQGFALAASGRLSPVGGPAFVPGAAQQRNAAGAPTISNVRVTPVTADLARVTFATNEPTTALVRANVGGSNVDYVDSYNLGFDAYKRTDEGPIGCTGTASSSCTETSAAYANKPVLGTRHEVLVTGLSAGATYALQLRATDLSGSLVTGTRSLTSPSTVFAPVADDIAQYASANTDPIDPAIVGGTGRRTGTQLYAGKLDASTGALGTFMFRLPTSVDPTKIKGAAVELVSAHDLTNHYKDDINLFVDLLPQSMEAGFRTNNYQTIHTAPSDARLNARTGYRRGGYQSYQFSFGCGQLGKLKNTLAATTAGSRAAAFRFDAETTDISLFSAEFGFNRRSAGADLRPRLVLYTDDAHGNAVDPQPCDVNAAAPKISNVGVQAAFDPDDVDNATVSWNTDIPSDSIVLFRKKGTSGGYTQVGTPARSTVHNVQVFGLDPNVDYEFAVRSTGCNGRASTDDGGGLGYDFFVDPTTPIPTDDYFFKGQPQDQATKGTENPTATFDRIAPTGPVPILQTTTAVANESFVNNNLAASWTGPYPPGRVNGPMTINLYASGVNGAISGVPLSVTVFADPDLSAAADPVQPDKIVATGTITGTAGPPGAPALITGQIPVVDGAPAVASRLHVQVASGDITEPVTLQIAYGSASASSSFEEPVAPAPDVGTTQASPGPRIPPPSAGSSGLNVAAVPTRGAPTAADIAAGTARCAPVRYQAPPGGTPSLRISDVNEWEGSAATGNHRVAVPVTLSTPTNGTVTVRYATRNGAATAPSDYIATSGTLTFAPGQMSNAVTVTFVGENRNEPDERFTVVLSAPVGATIADGTATVTIRKFQ